MTYDNSKEPVTSLIQEINNNVINNHEIIKKVYQEKMFTISIFW